MNFSDARDLAIEFGARLPRFDHTSPVAGCWLDRMEWIKVLVARGGYTARQIESLT
jgi:hypothetical protein